MCGMPDAHEPLWLRVGERPEQHAVEHTEHSGRSTDAEAERDDGSGDETRTPPNCGKNLLGS